MKHNLIRGSAETLSLATPIPKLDGILKIQGYKDLEKVRPTIRQAALTALEAFIEKTTPTVTYRIVKIHSVNRSGVVFNESIHLQSSIFQRYIGECSEAIVFVLTVGPGIDEQGEEWTKEEKLIEALFLESAAWLGIENATKQFVQIVRAWALDWSLRISRRLGPGYSYPIDGQQVMWELTDQKPLFQLIDKPEMPVALLDSAAMLPKMSRSGLFGLIPN